MIRFGVRQSFDKIEQIEDKYVNANVPAGVLLRLLNRMNESVITRVAKNI